MAVALSCEEFLRYTNGERQRWREWLRVHPDAVQAPVQPGGALPTVGKLIDHIFLAERRYVQRLRQEPLASTTGLTASNAGPLFDYGASVRRELEAYVRGLDEEEAEVPRAFVVRDGQLTLTPRKLLFSVLLHETRHWAQVALAVRLAGFEPPGDHDLLFSTALR
jgi:uncharacterized damage-inducible protein DinB